MSFKRRRDRNSAAIAYKIHQDRFAGGEDDIVARLVPFPGYNVHPFVVPEVMYFSSNFGMLELAIDFPNNPRGWPVVSERMLACLLSVGHFAYKATPVVMLDDRAGDDERFDARGEPLEQYKKTGWVFVEPACLDIIDWERSRYERLIQDTPEERDDEWLKDRGILSRLVITVPAGGLPPLFRVRGLEVLCFVSSAARAALDAMGAKGIRYQPLDEVWMTIDVPPGR